MLLETHGDYQFAENVEELNRSVSKLNKALEDQLELNQHLTASVRQLTEVIEFQNEQFRKLMKRFEEDGTFACSNDAKFSATGNLAPDFALI